MDEIPKQRIEDTVYDKLLENIREDVWKGGEKIPSENELCRELGVSRVSVRGAIRRLKAVGLVEVKHGIGTFVSQPDDTYDFTNLNENLNLTEKEFNDITALREAIETKAVMLIADSKNTGKLAKIEEAYLAMKKAAEEGDEETYSRQDYLFHLSILNASGNDLFIRIASIFKNQYYNYFKELNKFLFDNNNGNIKAVFDPGDPKDAHTVLYEYLCKEDKSKAKEATQHLLSENKKRFAAYLREKG